jgi:AraC-like DNA-binding protein
MKQPVRGPGTAAVHNGGGKGRRRGRPRKPTPGLVELLRDPRLAGLLSRDGFVALAHDLGMSERTLRRRLKEAGLSPRDLLSSWRRKELRRLLLDDVSLARIREELGFTTPGSLCHFVRREFRTTPTALRRQLKDEEVLSSLQNPALAERESLAEGARKSGLKT